MVVSRALMTVDERAETLEVMMAGKMVAKMVLKLVVSRVDLTVDRKDAQMVETKAGMKAVRMAA